MILCYLSPTQTTSESWYWISLNPWAFCHPFSSYRWCVFTKEMPGRSESVAAWWFYRPWSLTGRFRDVERYQTLQKCQEQECLGQNKHRQQNALCKTWIRKKPGLFGLKKDRWFFWWSDLWVLFRFNGFHSQLLFLPSRIYWILQSGTYETWNSLSKIVASKLVDLPLWYRWLDGRLYYIYIYIYT